MRNLSKQATQTFLQLISGLAVGDTRTIGEGGAFMPVHVERLTDDLYSVAHYYEQGGDLIADPDMELHCHPDGSVYPVAIQQPFGYRRAVEFGDKDTPTRVAPRLQRELAGFAGMWMRNIRAQQAEWFATQRRGVSARG